MAKRFIDTDIFKKGFVRGLDLKYKVLWLYILNDCNHAGIWECEIDVASLRLGVDINEKEAGEVFKDKIIVINDSKWFIPSFLDFQYGNLSKSNNVYKGVARSLISCGLEDYLKDIPEESTSLQSGRNRISKKLRLKIFSEDHFKCQYCQSQKDHNDLCVDHIVPLNKNGGKDNDNLTTACSRCNLHKSDILPWEFIDRKHDFLNPSEKIKSLILTLKGTYNPLKGVLDKDKDKVLDKDKDLDEKNIDIFSESEIKEQNNQNDTVVFLKKPESVEIMEYLNEVRKGEPLNTNNYQYLKVISRALENCNKELIKSIILFKYNQKGFKLEWLVPFTLFGDKFEQYKIEYLNFKNGNTKEESGGYNENEPSDFGKEEEYEVVG